MPTCNGTLAGACNVRKNQAMCIKEARKVEDRKTRALKRVCVRVRVRETPPTYMVLLLFGNELSIWGIWGQV